VITAHDALDRLLAEGAGRVAATELAQDRAALTRVVRRLRRRRITIGAGVTVAIAFTLALTVSQLPQPAGDITAGADAPPATPVVDLNAHPTVTVFVTERAEQVAEDLAVAFGVTRPVAYQALADALPPEAYGNPEGWIAVGEYTFKNRHDLAIAAQEMVGATVLHLIANGVPHDDWRKTVILASIVQQEVPAAADQSSVVRVLLNRLDGGLPLAVESVPEYAAQGLYSVRYSSVWPEAQYNVFERQGLPPSAIGASTPGAVEAAAKPATGDWLFFRTDETGNAHVSLANEKYAPGFDAFYPGTLPSN